MRKLVAAAILACALLAVGAAGAARGHIGGRGHHKAPAHDSVASDKGTAPTASSPATPTSTTTVADVPQLNWGVADDASKYADDGGAWFYQQMKGANLTSNRWTLAWNAGDPTAITELPFVERAAPIAQRAGIHVVISLYSGQNGTSRPDSADHDPTAFCAWAKIVAQTVKPWGIHDFIIGNEPSSTLYWSPQKDGNNNDVAAAAYEQLLATCYDQLHSLDDGSWTANVIGFGLSAKAATTDSNQPLAFLRDVGAAYRQSGRTTPIMDQLALHPYPLPATVPSPDKGYTNTPDAYGPPDLDRVKQAVYDAFHGTGQPTTLNGLTFRLDEFGWQTQESGAPYTGVENARPPGSAPAVPEAAQAQYLQQAASMFACDPTVTDIELFLLVDEANLAGWQSGLMTAGGAGVSRAKVAYSALAPIFGAGRAACTTGLKTWTPQGSRAGNSASSSGSTSDGGSTDSSGSGSSQASGSPKAKPVCKLVTVKQGKKVVRKNVCTTGSSATNGTSTGGPKPKPKPKPKRRR